MDDHHQELLAIYTRGNQITEGNFKELDLKINYKSNPVSFISTLISFSNLLNDRTPLKQDLVLQRFSNSVDLIKSPGTITSYHDMLIISSGTRTITKLFH